MAAVDLCLERPGCKLFPEPRRALCILTRLLRSPTSEGAPAKRKTSKRNATTALFNPRLLLLFSRNASVSFKEVLKCIYTLKEVVVVDAVNMSDMKCYYSVAGIGI
jgi:hypothetical protein